MRYIFKVLSTSTNVKQIKKNITKGTKKPSIKTDDKPFHKKSSSKWRYFTGDEL